MGYSTYFSGIFKLSRKLTVTERETFNAVSGTGAFVERLGALTEEHEESSPDSECPWRLAGDDNKLEDAAEEKMYNWSEWLEYLCEHVFVPAGIKVNGQVTWHGEDTGDAGVIFVKDNDVRLRSIDEMPEPDWTQPEPDSDEAAPGATPLAILQGRA